jgi:CelD/BcsL family acetyltransferase involved in cellulose biosynthesis
MSTLACAAKRHRVRVSGDFGGAMADRAAWGSVAASGDTRTVFQQWHWQRTWWQVYGRGRLVVVNVGGERSDGGVAAIAPLFVDGDMAFFVGSGGSDYLDFVGDISEPGVVEAILSAVLKEVPGLLGFRFYHVPEGSRTGARLQEAAGALGLQCVDEGSMVAPLLDLGPAGEAGLRAAQKKSLVRHERAFCARGELTVTHLHEGEAIGPWLEAFFDQHVRRWQQTSHPSLFCEPVHREFYRRLAAGAAADDGLRFTVVESGGRAIAFHFGFCLGGRYLWYKPSFEIELARWSPGEVLLRQLLLAAVQEGAQAFDFGLGDETFKHRFASRVPLVRTWGLYPRS